MYFILVDMKEERQKEEKKAAGVIWCSAFLFYFSWYTIRAYMYPR
jgi:hypothetical protein